jgi:hypothetical protein
MIIFIIIRLVIGFAQGSVRQRFRIPNNPGDCPFSGGGERGYVENKMSNRLTKKKKKK